MKSRRRFAISWGLMIAAIVIGLFCNKYFKTVEFSAVIGYGFKELTWTREDMGRIVYDDYIEDTFGELLSPCSYDDFKTNVLSRLRQSIGLRARTSHEYEQMFRELSIRIGFANMQNKRVAVFSLKKHAVLQLGFPPRLCIAVEDVVPFLDACADAAVDMYPISQNARFERSVSSISNIVQKQERTVQRLKEKMKHCGQSSGESAGNQSTDIEMAQKLYDDLKQKLEETEKLRGTVPYKIKVIKRAAEESYHVMG